MYKQVKAAAISLKPEKWAKERNANKLEAFVRRAARNDPDLIVTIEGVLEGYVVMDVIEGRKSAEEMIEIAEPLDGPNVRRIQSLAKSLKTCICFGFAERVGTDVYNTAVFIDHTGKILGRYQKVQFAEGANASWPFNRMGTSLRAFDTPLGRVGIVICADRWNPMISRTLVLDGAQMLLIPSYGMKNRMQNQTVLARARENGVPIIEANVGVNLIISKGEIVAYKWGNDQITVGIIDVPAEISTTTARAQEKEYFDSQGQEMERRYRETLKRIKGEPTVLQPRTCFIHPDHRDGFRKAGPALLSQGKRDRD